MSAATAWVLPADCTCTPDHCRGASCDSCWRRHGCPVDEPTPLADRDVLHAVCLCTDGQHAHTQWAGEHTDPARTRSLYMAIGGPRHVLRVARVTTTTTEVVDPW